MKIGDVIKAVDAKGFVHDVPVPEFFMVGVEYRCSVIVVRQCFIHRIIRIFTLRKKHGTAQRRIERIGDNEFRIGRFSLFGLLIKMVEIIAFLNEFVQERRDFLAVHLFIDDKCLSGFKRYKDDVSSFGYPELILGRFAVVGVCVVLDRCQAVFISDRFLCQIKGL